MLGLTSGRAERRAFPWTWWVTPQSWRGFQSTVSQIALLPEPSARPYLMRRSDVPPRLARQRDETPCRCTTRRSAFGGGLNGNVCTTRDANLRICSGEGKRDDADERVG